MGGGAVVPAQPDGWGYLQVFSLSFTGKMRTVKGKLHADKGKITFDMVDGCPEQPQARNPVFH